MANDDHSAGKYLLDSIALHPVIGVALLIGVLFFMFQTVFWAGAAPADAIADGFRGELLPSPETTGAVFFAAASRGLMRWGEGGIPFSSTPARHMGGWVRLRSDVSYDKVTEAHLLALVDAWPPAVLSHLSKPAPGSSLTWTIEFVHPIPSLTTHDWCLYRAEIEHALDGYGHIAARLWTADGQLLALSRQTTTVFD